MDAFVKTRRNRKTPEAREEQKPAYKSSTSSHSTNSTTEHHRAWAVSSSSGRSPFESPKRSSDGSESSSFCDLGSSSSCEDRQSICSSPLSESSYCSLSSDETTVVHAETYNPANDYSNSTMPSSWLHTSNAGRDTGSPLFLLDTDVMAQVLTFLEPSEILGVLTMPLCKAWDRSYGSQQDLWKTLCLLEPFNAKVGDEVDDDSSSTDSFASLPAEPAINIFGEYRLMFTSFVRCVRYLDRIQEDTRKGKAPSVIDYGQSGFPHFGMSRNLKKFLAKRKGAFDSDIEASSADKNTNPVGVTDDGYRKRRAEPAETMAKKPRFGDPMITRNLLGPPASKSAPSQLQLTRSCAIFSIVNWMVAYPDVEGIQIKCVATLPVLLEDEAQRLTAQRVGLVEVVLRAMLRYPDCLKLHVAAFHAMVLLARPLGGREGMLFDNSNAESSTSSSPGLLARSPSPVRGGSSSLSGSNLNGINGVIVMLDSMRHFENEAELQAMACWAMVNLALVPAQKTMILSLGGIEATTNAMRRHPKDFDVQFRALFALINLVVASKIPKPLSFSNGPLGPNTEKDVLDATVNQVSSLVVIAMKNFCSRGTMLNRACLVLHNLAQSQEYLSVLLWTPQCYQMLEWCIANYPTDPVLRRSATGTLHRLQVLLSDNQSLRSRFLESIRAQDELASIQNNAPPPVPGGQYV